MPIIGQAPSTNAKPTMFGTTFGVIGDSTVGGDQLTPGSVSSIATGTWAQYAQGLSGGRMLLTVNAGTSGQQSTAIANRFDTDITPYAPQIVIILCGTNDIAASVGLSTFQTNIKSMVGKARAFGGLPVLCTITPKSTSASTIYLWNQWIRRYAQQQGLVCIDFHTLLVNTSDGNYASAYLNDGIHPNQAGYLAMGQLVANQLAALCPPGGISLSRSTSNNGSLITNGHFTGTPSSGIVTGWSAADLGATGTITRSIVTDSLVPGFMQQLTVSATTANRGVSTSGLNVTTGNRVGVSGVVTTDGGVAAFLVTNGTGSPSATTSAQLQLPAGVALTRFPFYLEFTPTGQFQGLQLYAGPGTGTVAFGQIGYYDLTANGTLA